MSCSETVNISLQLSILVPSTIPVVEKKSLKTQYCLSYVPVEAREVDPANVKGNRTTSSANYESSPGQILSLIQTVLSVSPSGSKAGVISSP